MRCMRPAILVDEQLAGRRPGCFVYKLQLPECFLYPYEAMVLLFNPFRARRINCWQQWQ